MPETSADEPACDECGWIKFTKDIQTGEVICGACGLVVAGPSVSRREEQRVYDRKHQSRVRTNPENLLLHDRGLSSVVPRDVTDAKGNVLSNETRMQMHRLRRQNVRAGLKESRARNLSHSLTVLDKFRTKLGLSRVIAEEAATWYRRALRAGVVRGRSIEGCLAACVYLACRVHEVPTSLDAVASVVGFTKKEISGYYRAIIHQLGVKVRVHRTRPYIAKYVSVLELPGVVERRALEILDICDRARILGGKSPSGVATAILYIACRDCAVFITQKMLSTAAGVTEVTIRNRYQEIRSVLDGIEDASESGVTLSPPPEGKIMEKEKEPWNDTWNKPQKAVDILLAARKLIGDANVILQDSPYFGLNNVVCLDLFLDEVLPLELEQALKELGVVLGEVR